jgi:hypothetical protein
MIPASVRASSSLLRRSAAEVSAISATSSARPAPSAAIGANCALYQALVSCGLAVAVICLAMNAVIVVAAPITQLAIPSRIELPTLEATLPSALPAAPTSALTPQLTPIVTTTSNVLHSPPPPEELLWGAAAACWATPG